MKNIENLPDTTDLTETSENWYDNINIIKQFIDKESSKLTIDELRERKIFLELLVKKYKNDDKKH